MVSCPPGETMETTLMSNENPIAVVLVVVKEKSVVAIVSHLQRIGCQPGKTTSHGGQYRLWSAEQGKENKKKRESLARRTKCLRHDNKA